MSRLEEVGRRLEEVGRRLGEVGRRLEEVLPWMRIKCCKNQYF